MKLSSLQIVAAVACAVSLHGQSTFLVNDTMTDTDRIGGLANASTTAATALTQPIGTPTSTNTQWVVNSAGQLTASATGMLWNMNATSNRMALGYFPAFTVQSGNIYTFSFRFTTGAVGTGDNNLRFALVNGSPGGYRTTDGFSATDSSFVGDVGYGIFSGASNVGLNSANANLSLNTYERVVTSSNNLLGTGADWGGTLTTATPATNTLPLGSSSGATGNLQGNTTYLLEFTMRLDGGALSFTTSLSGGNLSNLNYTIVDSDNPTLTFDTFAMRVGAGSTQFASFNFESLTIASATAPVPEPSTYAAILGLVALGVIVQRRRIRR